MSRGDYLYIRIKESLAERILFEKNPKGGERTNHAGVQGKRGRVQKAERQGHA